MSPAHDLLQSLLAAADEDSLADTLLRHLSGAAPAGGHLVVLRAAPVSGGGRSAARTLVRASGDCEPAVAAGVAPVPGSSDASQDESSAGVRLEDLLPAEASRRVGIPGLAELSGGFRIAELDSGDETLGWIGAHDLAGAHDLTGAEVGAGDESLVGIAMAALIAVDRLRWQRRALAAEEQVSSTMDRVGHLIRGVSHDLKNPLGAIDGYVQLLEAGVRGDLQPEQLEWTGRITQAVRHMLAILSDLLDLARSDTGALALDKQPLPMSGILREAVHTARGSAEKAGITLEAEIPDDLPRIVSDAGRVRQVFDDLFSLLLQSVPAGEAIRIVATSTPAGAPGAGPVPSPGAAHGTGAAPAPDASAPATSASAAASASPGASAPGVADDAGVRLTMKAPGRTLLDVVGDERPFDGFFRVDSQAGRDLGTGLELALARRLARCLGGDVSIEAEGEEVVLVFEVREFESSC